jgi:hypothetical protein
LVTNSALEAELVTERSGLDPVNGDLLAVHLDHRDPLAVALLELGDPGDVDLRDGEAELGRERAELLAGPLAEVTVARDDERDGGGQG